MDMRLYYISLMQEQRLPCRAEPRNRVNSGPKLHAEPQRGTQHGNIIVNLDIKVYERVSVSLRT